MNETNCNNCGAPLKNYRCEYCNTEKKEYKKTQIEIDKMYIDLGIITLIELSLLTINAVLLI